MTYHVGIWRKLEESFVYADVISISSIPIGRFIEDDAKMSLLPGPKDQGFFFLHLYRRESPYDVIFHIYKKKESSQGIYIRGREKRGEDQGFSSGTQGEQR
jgi:hypothetical protein